MNNAASSLVRTVTSSNGAVAISTHTAYDAAKCYLEILSRGIVGDRLMTEWPNNSPLCRTISDLKVKGY